MECPRPALILVLLISQKSLEDNGVLLMPTWPGSAFYKYQAVCKVYNVCYDYFVNVLDLASTAVPIGLDDNNMPLSIQVTVKKKLSISTYRYSVYK